MVFPVRGPRGGAPVSRHSCTDSVRCDPFQGALVLEGFLQLFPEGHPLHGISVDNLIQPNPATVEAFRQSLGSQSRSLLSLSEETDPEIFYSDLFSLARNLESDHLEVAAVLYQGLVSGIPDFPPPPLNLSQRAQRRLRVFAGEGTFAEQLEWQTPQVLKEAFAPAPLLGMAVGGLAFRSARLGAMAGLRTLPANLLTRGIGARVMAAAAGLTVEAPAFTLATDGLTRLIHPHEPAMPLGRQIAGGYLLLASLRLFGLASQGLAGRYATGETLLARFSRGALPQVGMLNGILSAQALEISLGLKENRGFDGILAESLGTLFQFNVAGRLSSQILGSRYRMLESQLDRQTDRLALQSAYPRNFDEFIERVRSHEWLDIFPASNPLIPVGVGPRQNLPGNFGLVFMSGKAEDPSPTQGELDLGPLPSRPPPSGTRRKNPIPTPVPPRFEASREDTYPNGRGLLPDLRPQKVMTSVTEGEFPSDTQAELRNEVHQKIRQTRRHNPRALLHQLKGFYEREAQAQGVRLDVWLGRTLSEANAAEVNAALTLLRPSRLTDQWKSTDDILWLQGHRIGGGAARIGEILGENFSESSGAQKALMDLAVNHRSGVLAAVENLLLHGNILTVYRALELAEQLKAQEFRPLLRTMAFDKKNIHQWGARDALVEMGDRGLVSYFRNVANNPRSGFETRARAAYGLGKLGYREEAIPLLQELVEAGGPQSRLAAAIGLFRLNAQGTIPSSRQLIQGMDGPQILNLAKTCLEENHIRHAEFFLNQALGSAEYVTQWEAIELISQHNLLRLRGHVRKLEASPYPNVRWSAVKSRAKMSAATRNARELLDLFEYTEDTPTAVQPRDRNQREEKIYQIRMEAARGLSNLRLSKSQRQRLSRTLNEWATQGPNSIRVEAAQLLATQFNEPRGSYLLRQLLNHPDLRTRTQAASALDRVNPNWDQAFRDYAKTIRMLVSELPLDGVPDPK